MAKTINLTVDDFSLPTPEELHSRLESQAGHASMNMEDNIKHILTSNTYQVPEWSCFPRAVIARLSIYRFCFQEREQTIKVMKSLKSMTARK